MINPNQAWTRCKSLSQFKGMKLSDMRPIVYTQSLLLGAAGTGDAGPTPVQFPNGAIVLGICSSAALSPAAVPGTPGRIRSLYAMMMAYTGGENIVPVMTIVEALMGGGDGTQFPARELVIAPNQNLNLTLRNYCTSALSVDVAFHCLVSRLAQ